MSSIFKMRAGAAVVAGVGLRSVAAFGLTKLCAAFLGPVEFARYGHFLMLASYLFTASSCGLANAYTVYLVRRRTTHAGSALLLRRDTSSVVLAGAATGAIAALVLAVVALAGLGGAFLPPIRACALPLWLAYCVGTGAGAAFLAALLAEQRHGRYQALMAATPILSCAVLGAVALLGRLTAESAIACYLGGFLVPAVAYVVTGPRIRLAERESLRAVIRFALPYLMPSLLVPTIGTFGILTVRRVIAGNVSSFDLGLWQALWRLAEAYMGILISIITALYMPRLAQAASRREAVRVIGRAGLTSLGFYLPVAAVWLLAPHLAINVLLAPEFGPMSRLVPLQVVGDALKVLCSVLVLTCAALLKPNLALVAEVVMNGAFIVAAIVLTPRAGAMGAVGSYAAAYLVLAIVLIPLVRRVVLDLPSTRSPQGATGVDGA